jgi:hypothetical protein
MRSASVHSRSRISSHSFNLTVYYSFYKSPYLPVFWVRLIMLASSYFTSVGMITFLKETKLSFLPHHCVARKAAFWKSDCRIQRVNACYPQRRTPGIWRSIINLVSARHSDTDTVILLQCLSVFIRLWDLHSSFTFPGRPPSATATTHPLSSVLQRTVWVLSVFQVLYLDWETTRFFSGRYSGYCCFTTFYQLLNMVIVYSRRILYIIITCIKQLHYSTVTTKCTQVNLN